MTPSDFHTSISHSPSGLFLLVLLTFCPSCRAQTDDKTKLERVITIPTNAPFPESSWLTTKKAPAEFPLVENGVPSGILVSASDYPGVVRIAGLFQNDLGYVSGHNAELVVAEEHKADNLIIVGTVGKSKLIDGLVKEKKIECLWTNFAPTAQAKGAA